MSNTKKIPDIFAKRGKDDKVFQFDFIGFNEVYVHNNEKGQAYMIEKIFGVKRLTTPLFRASSFESFVRFSTSMYESRISGGDGFLGEIEDVSLDFELDMKTIALGCEFHSN